MVAEQQLQDQSGSTQYMYESNQMLTNQSVPQATIAFLKEMLTMADEAKRSMLFIAFFQLPTLIPTLYALTQSHVRH